MRFDPGSQSRWGRRGNFGLPTKDSAVATVTLTRSVFKYNVGFDAIGLINAGAILVGGFGGTFGLVMTECTVDRNRGGGVTVGSGTIASVVSPK